MELLLCAPVTGGPVVVCVLFGTLRQLEVAFVVEPSLGWIPKEEASILYAV